MTNHWTVYMYEFPNGKRYIGATSQKLYHRQGTHFQKYNNCKALWESIQNYGVENIKQTILFEGDIPSEQAMELERKYIAKYKTTDPEFGYNSGNGGEGLYARTLSEERKEILRRQLRAFHKARIGTHHSECSKKKMSLAHAGKKRGPMSEETKRKISIANSRENMSEETHIRRSLSKQKKVYAVNNETGERIDFACMQEAATFFNVQGSSITRWIQGIRKPSNNYSFYLYSPTTTE